VRCAVACLLAVLILMLSSCRPAPPLPPAQTVQVSGKQSSYFAQDFIPAAGGTVEWTREDSDDPFQIYADVGWPCKPKGDGKTATCKFHAIPPGDNYIFAYKIGPPQAGHGGKQTYGNLPGPPMFVLVGHCKSCTGFIGGAAGNGQGKNRDGTNSSLVIRCNESTPPRATVLDGPAGGTVGQKIRWTVEGRNPTATLTFNSESCTPSPITGAMVSCTAKQTGTYMITGVPGCEAPAGPFPLSVTNQQ
jgi:hypothetical protein